MVPSRPAFPLTPIAGVDTASVTWATAPGVDRYQIDSDPDGVLPWSNVDFTSLTQSNVIPASDGGTNYVQVRPVDERNMPGNTGEVWQLRPFTDSTLLSSSSTAVSSANGGIVAYNDKVLVWPPRALANGLQVYRSGNYGQTWSTYTPSGTISSTGPRAIAGFNGRAALFYQDGSATTTLRVQTFNDLGPSGTATLGTLQSGVNIDLLSAKASVDNNGLVVAYADNTAKVIRVATADGAMSYTLRPSIATTAANTIGALEVAKVDFTQGRVVIVWREYSAGDPRDDLIRAVESQNSGASWGTPFTLLTGTSSPTSQSASYEIGSTDLSGSNNGAYSVLARTTEFNDFQREPANLWLTVTGTDHSTSVSSSSYVQVKLDSETVDKFAFDTFANSDGHYVAWRAETLDGTVAKVRFAYCFADCHLFSSWDRSLLKVWTSYVRDQGRFVSMTVSQATSGYEPAIYVMYTQAQFAGTWRDLNILSRGVNRRVR
jgi:hypothetical protein